MNFPKEEAVKFFSAFYCGEHHIPGPIREWGNGYCVNHVGELATFDFDKMTRLVFMGHDKCVRVAVAHGGPRALRIMIWKREGREGIMSVRHPTIESALELWRRNNKEVQP